MRKEGGGHAPAAVGPAAASRARDVSRPTPEDVEAAERRVVIRRGRPDDARPARPRQERSSDAS